MGSIEERRRTAEAGRSAGQDGFPAPVVPAADRRRLDSRPRALLLTRERRDGRRQGMEVGKPIRTHEVEPVKDPVPRERPEETRRERTERKPLPAEAPAR